MQSRENTKTNLSKLAMRTVPNAVDSLSGNKTHVITASMANVTSDVMHLSTCDIHRETVMYT